MAGKIMLVSSSFEEVSLMTAETKLKAGIKLSEESHYPLGIAYLHSYLESYGHEVRSLCLNSHAYEHCLETVIKTIEEFSPDVIGLQLLTPNRVSSYRIIEYVREKYPNIHLIVGGVHATVMFRQILERYPFLIVVRGEGEITLEELVRGLLTGAPHLDAIDGIAFNRNGAIHTTNERQLIGDLDMLPFPRHDMFFNEDRTLGCLMTTRGCPFSCSFCCLRSISRKAVRHRSVKNVVDEIEYMAKTFPRLTTIWIHDDSLFLDNARAIQICDEIIRRKIKMEFIGSGRVKPLCKELVRKLEQANFSKVLVGLESGDEGILRSARKAITQQDVINAFKLFADSSVDLFALLIVGLPGETHATIMTTVDFVQKLQRIKYIHYDQASVGLLTVYPGTEIYEISKTKGMIDDTFWLMDKPTPLFTVENDREQLFRFKEIMMNHISMNRIMTPAGFRAQLYMVPHIGRYLMRYRGKLSVLFLSRLSRALLPGKIHDHLRRWYKRMKKSRLTARAKKEPSTI